MTHRPRSDTFRIMGMFLKRALASLMTWVGVDEWPQMADADKLNAVIGLFIGGMSIVIAGLALVVTWAQWRIAERQAEIAEVQHEIQSRRIRLEPWAHLLSAVDDDVTLVVRVRNSGRRTALHWQWHFYIRQELQATVRQFGGSTVLNPVRIDTAADYDFYVGESTTALFPDDSGSGPWPDVPLLLISMKASLLNRLADKGLDGLEWFFHTDDGRSPDITVDGSGPGGIRGALSLRQASHIVGPPW